jgi:hypothetical protein
MIEAFSANTSNYSFRIRILERRMWRCDHFFNLHPFHPALKFRSVDRISISEQIARSGIIRKGFDDLLSGPLGCRMLCHIEMNDLPALVEKDDKVVQNAEIDCRDREKIYGRNLIRMIGKKCLLGLRWRLGEFHPIFCHGLFRDIESEKAQLGMNTWRTPDRVLARDAADQLTNLFVNRRTADRRFRLPSPIKTVSLSMPFDDSVGFNDDQRIPPILPES